MIESDDGIRCATVAQLQADIDSGRTGDKVAGIDHAAPPLGTDEEAAGTPVPAEMIAQARRYECNRKTTRDAIGESAVVTRALAMLGFIAGVTLIVTVVWSVY